MWYLLVLLGLVILGLIGWRQLDHSADRQASDMLVALSPRGEQRFELGMVAQLPEPARRYFGFTITPGTPIRTAMKIEMAGEMGMGTKAAPNYQPMQASQVLAPPHGFVWKVRSGPLSGSDAATPETSWTRFWLVDLLPVVRVSNADHQRSAFGRTVAEAAFWAPASLLPSEQVTWEQVDADTARATVKLGAFVQSVDITVDERGAPTKVQIERWSNENPERVFRLQPFGGHLSDYRTFGGYRLPTRVDGGNHFGTPDYFPFFKARVSRIEPLP